MPWPLPMPPATMLSSLFGATRLSGARRPIHSRRPPSRAVAVEVHPVGARPEKRHRRRGRAGKSAVSPQRAITSKVSLRHFGTRFSTTSASTTSSTAALTVSASPSATSRTRSPSAANTSRKRRSAAALSRSSQPIRCRRRPAAARRAPVEVVAGADMVGEGHRGRSAGGRRLAGQHGLDPDDLAHAAADIIGHVTIEAADLHIDRQRRSRRRAVPFCGTRPRLANSSTTRGMTPGSGRASDGIADGKRELRRAQRAPARRTTGKRTSRKSSAG